jgi:hypothetical protein
MNADVLLTIAFTLYAVLIAAGVGFVFVRSWNESALDEGAEQRLKDLSAHTGARATAGDHGGRASTPCALAGMDRPPIEATGGRRLRSRSTPDGVSAQ